MSRRTEARGTRKPLVEAVAYLRTSSAANVGDGKDSDKRQREAIAAFARHAGFTIVEEFYDAAVSGADPIDTRPGFRALLERIVSNGVRTVIVEDASRFARTLMVQEAGIATLAGLGVQVLTSRGDDLTDSDDEMRVAMRQIAGVFSQLEKTRLVKKLRAARGRRRAEVGKCEGRKGFAEMAAEAARRGDRSLAEAIAMAKRLHRASPKTGQRSSLRRIAAELARAGHVNINGREYNPASIKAMIESRGTRG
jgi:DNA invertase Pin-like site-specific DNA recombinase